MSDPSKEQHQDDVNAGFHLEVSAKVDGGKCLNRHESAWTPSSCSHRWQAYQRALDDKHIYNWPRYASLSSRTKVRTDAKKDYQTSKDGVTKVHPVFPHFYRLLLSAPAKGDWDVGVGDNFKQSSAVPYYHNAHHLVTNSELRKELNKTGAAIERSYPAVNGVGVVRGGLLRAGYNLNHKQNMIILPMDRAVAGTLNLPRHLDEVTGRSHADYSGRVKLRLQTILNEYKQDIEAELKKGKGHTKLKHKLCKEKLEDLSEEIYKAIASAARNPGYDGTLETIEF
ncbi:hypothetical protein BE21_02575 [Sorangium cellulosum]|uniref:Uncharacterized protein n=1 Tax=Sorangium cellulosum TaxID=56 RepID=A0A150TRX8_SORCE|nr:hypothetical protein BE21_02575 [Sorangium cellulosum]